MITIKLDIDNERSLFSRVYTLTPMQGFKILNILDPPSFPSYEKFVERWTIPETNKEN